MPGATYDVQLWGLDDRTCCGGRTENFSGATGDADASSTFSLNSNISIIGTFVADGSGQQAIYVNGPGGPNNLNAFSVQALPVPEPATIALFGISSLGLCVFIRRHQNGER
ncbi:MAG TPA: PEP-CTERM sorting domain-containing protein [Pirellulales bacterium]|jgi:hypothetical protein|nr:PEP-CTERM sorting domain-containing protein [Pirellulales bacterium]